MRALAWFRPPELGAAFVYVHQELVPQIKDDHAPHIESWLAVLPNDKRAIFSAASLAHTAGSSEEAQVNYGYRVSAAK